MKNTASPAKSAIEELETLHHLFLTTVEAYSAHWEAVFAQNRKALDVERKRAKAPKERLHDLRDMVALMRMLKVKPEKGRRRDLKKIESVLEELSSLTEEWAKPADAKAAK